MSALQAFSIYVAMKENPKSFNVEIGPTQTMPSCHGLNFSWGEHCLLKTFSHKTQYSYCLKEDVVKLPYMHTLQGTHIHWCIIQV